MKEVGFTADLRACLALRDARARENAEARQRAVTDADLYACLLESARRRGQADVDWADYFRNAGINYP